MTSWTLNGHPLELFNCLFNPNLPIRPETSSLRHPFRLFIPRPRRLAGSCCIPARRLSQGPHSTRGAQYRITGDCLCYCCRSALDCRFGHLALLAYQLQQPLREAYSPQAAYTTTAATVFCTRNMYAQLRSHGQLNPPPDLPIRNKVTIQLRHNSELPRSSPPPTHIIPFPHKCSLFSFS